MKTPLQICTEEPKNPNDLSILDNPFEGYSKDDIIYSQHAIILQQKKEIAELKQQLTGHLISVHY